MSGHQFTRKERGKLRALAQEAYARELDLALRDLDSAFSDWRQKHISGFQLADFIHDFHQGASRDLFSDYTRLDPGFLVARALARHLLEPGEVPEPLRVALEDLTAYCRERYEDQDE